MSYDNQNIMKNLFGGKLNDEIRELKESRKISYDELGYGINIQGNKHGTFNEYLSSTQNPSRQSKIYLSNTRLDNVQSLSDLMNLSVEDIVKNNTDEFKPGEIPKLLMMFYNIIHDKNIYVEWKRIDKNVNRERNEIIGLTQFYSIPSAYSKNLSWWDSYGILFVGPEDLKSGTYCIDIVATDIKITLTGEGYNNVANNSKSSSKFFVN